MIDNLSKETWCNSLKNKHSHRISDEIPKLFQNSWTLKNDHLQKKSGRGAESYNSVFQKILKFKNVQCHSRFTDKSPSLTEWVIGTVRNFLKKQISGKKLGSWLSVLSSVFKNKRIPYTISARKKRINNPSKLNEKTVYFNRRDKRW